MDAKIKNWAWVMQVAGLAVLLLAFPLRGWSQANDLHKIFSDYYEFELRENPDEATFLGRNDYNDHWADPSYEHTLVVRESLRQISGRLQAFPQAGLTESDLLSYRLLQWQLKHEIEGIDVLQTFYTVNHMVGGHLNIFSTVAAEPAITVKDYENQVARLRDLPRWVDKTIAAADSSIEQKKIPPKLVVQRELEQ